MTIREVIQAELDNGRAMCYGQANEITNSQSGERRLREILADDPDKYQYVMVKSQHGGSYMVFAKRGAIDVKEAVNGDNVCYIHSNPIIAPLLVLKSTDEAKAQIKEVKR